MTRMKFFLAMAVAATTATTAFGAGRLQSSKVVIGPDNNPKTVTIASDAKAYDLLPARIKESGQLTAAIESNAGYPNSVTKDGKNYGLTIDLGNALAAALGVTVTQTTMPFSNIIPSLGAGRVDFSPSLFSDTASTAKRREVVDFVDAAYSFASLFAIKKDSPLGSMTLDTACGHVVAANTGSTQAILINDQSKKCVEQGKKAIELRQFNSNSEALLAVKSGRAEAALFNRNQVKFMLKYEATDLKEGTTEQQKVGYTAIAFNKGSDLVPAFRAAMITLHKSGMWKQILAHYNNDDVAPTLEVIENTKALVAGEPVK